MSRIEDLPAQSRSPDQERLYQTVIGARGMFYSPYKIWIHSPQIGFGMETIGTHLNSDTANLSAGEMEMAALITAQYWGATYVIKNHSKHAAKAGLGSDVIAALVSGADPKLTDLRLASIHKFTSSTLRGETPTDLDFEGYVSVLTRVGIAELLGVIGYFTSVSLAMKTHGIT